ncbi:AAA family ATPase [Tannockella kyphosi]|uniref:AAA family ATPase n=1 Tax=Tannockella kyphosi TaxID=2899121 RepID=UPI00201336F4|nr:AAA family ATPase [Tannockella kyphosi]
MYLKKIELHGFKSFADKVHVEFQPGITGVVGPNGCGKSNISDAVRWVLGEQSVKSLRGSNMSDVIFAGSQDRKAQSLAEVTLVFDNSDKFMQIEYDEVEITRRIYRLNNEAEYLINRQPCRLKDIVDLIMDTGLGKDSLSIISQGNISSFADCKPDERRAIFEDAAGVSKYKKRKLESIRKLERTTENLERIGDIVHELEKQIGPLEKQKIKAEKYLTLKEELTSVEVSVLVCEIQKIKELLDELSLKIKEFNEQRTTIEAGLFLQETNNDEIKKKMFALDSEIHGLQTQLMEAMTNVSNLESAKIEVDQKRKFLMENASEDVLHEKIAQLKDVLSESLQEYNDRYERSQETQKDIQELMKKQTTLNEQLNEDKSFVESTVAIIQRKKSKKEMLLEELESRSNLNHGVRTIVEYAKRNKDIIGVLEDLVIANEGYEQAIATSLGNAVQFIVTSTDIAARSAISYLHDNKAGRATFLPMDVMEPRSVRQEHLLVCTNMNGYLGIASDFVKSNKKIGNIIENQLGNIIVCDTLENANSISKALFGRYKIVALNGDVVNVGGSMTGGSYKKSNSNFTKKRELENLQDDLVIYEKKLVEKRNEINELENSFKEISHDLLQKQISYGQLEVVVQRKKEKLVSIKSEYESLTDQKLELENFTSGKVESKLIQDLNEAIKLRDNLNEEIKSKRLLRMSYVEQSEVLEQELKNGRKQLNQIQGDLTKETIDATKQEVILENHLVRLNNEYRMTYEFAYESYVALENLEEAKEIVMTLRHQMDELGHVNLDAIEEYQNVFERYESMNNQRLDLLQAQDKILEAIKEMDEIMVEKFSSTFEKINIEFNTVFRSLFGGGKAEIRYSDPTNILETGIDIDVQPPGKAVQNISLFSGGEKALIAISCLFAILRVRPVPLCILDEVEAALDIANVERFAKYLREFSSTTQFIVVTHREGMMQECDVLYGATMQQKGVTKLVSVKIDEAIDLTDA